MELRGQENDMRTSLPSSFSHQSTAVERRRDGNHNGNNNSSTILTYTQTLDHHHRQQTRSPNSDRFSKSSNSKVRYRECLRNHAASVGGNVFDGCGEFMPGGEEGSLEALKCAACECHRNFHRKEVDGETQFSPSSRRTGSTAMVHSLQLPPPLPSPTILQHHQRYSMGLHSTSPTAAAANMVQPMNVAFGGGGTESSSEDLNVFHSNADGIPPPPPYVLSKKRYRTKFTQDQKDKMMAFAEKVGWRINKQDEGEVEKFCAEVAVRRQVFKVWMHNNKNVKKQQQQPENENENEHEHEHEQEQGPLL